MTAPAEAARCDPGSAPDARSSYIQELEREAAVYPAVPDVEVSYDFSYTIRLPAHQGGSELPSVLRSLLGPLPALASKLRGQRGGATAVAHADVRVLTGCHGTLAPGTLTLLLAAPGHGKSSFLRALAGHIAPAALNGRLSYSGVAAADLPARGVHMSLLACCVDQTDTHLPFLTVRETVAFAAALSTVEPRAMPHPLLAAAAAARTERVLRLLRLEACADTLVGGGPVRGVSGGEKKRVSVAEALVSNARLLCLDEISTGLDASVTFDIMASIHAWARAMRGTVVVSLQQPTPEAYALFDDVILLREGATVYHGARAALPAYVARLGFTPPAKDGGDIADWLLELLASPTGVLRRQAAGEAVPPGAPRTSAALAAAWRGADAAAGANTNAAAPAGAPTPPLALGSPFAVQQYGRPYPRAALPMFAALVRRQALLSWRNKMVLAARSAAACIASLILGLVWLDLDVSQSGAKLGMFVFCLAQMAFANFPEISWVVEYKFVGHKQLRAGLYPAWSYTLAASLLQAPIAAIESAAFSIILYFMADLARDGGRWAFFYLVVLSVNIAIGSLFRLLAYVVPTPEAAMSAPGPFVALQLIFAGFLIAPKQMGTGMWMIFMYYSSTFAYGARSMAHNEFGSARYDIYPSRNASHAALVGGGQRIVEQGASGGAQYYSRGACDADAALACGSETYGRLTLRALNINAHPAWKWGGIGFLFFFTLLANVAAARVVKKKAHESGGRGVGSSYLADSSEAEDSTSSDKEKDAVAVALPADGASAAGALPFTRASVAWRELTYTVDTPAGSKTLLNGISGVAMPGRLLALMGASGAGKTTLLDVIASRKTSGATGGAILLNGVAPHRGAFARMTAYCEQADVHSPLATVGEALAFSAALRLPSSISPGARRAFVEEVTDLLELRPLVGRLVGEVGEADGLSPSQRKVLTVAVELVSNAPILFLDEPTSGLDARAAAMVMRVVRKIASTGRTVCSTIHQPSADVFSMFDDVLLMQRGGWMAYFGEVGPHGATLVGYLQAVPGAHAYPAGMNAASWMLDVLAGTSSSDGADGAAAAAEQQRSATPTQEGALEGSALQARLLTSAHWVDTAAAALDAACSPSASAEQADAQASAALSTTYAVAFPVQLRALVTRTARSYSRNVSYVFSRIKTCLILNLLFSCVWYKAQQAVDCAPAQDADHFVCLNTPGGVQSIVAIIFITALFTSVVCTTALLPYMMRSRRVLYRERASSMYAPEAYALAHLLVELPWLLLTVFIVITPLYFMVGFTPTASAYFFYILVIWLTVLCFLSLGQWVSALFSTGALAQALLSLLLPLAALFAGVYLPKAQLPDGAATGHPHVHWVWAYYIDPISHAVEALVPSRFHDASRPTTVGHMIRVPRGAGFEEREALQFLRDTRGSRYEDRWSQVGYLVAIAGGMQLFHFYAVRHKVHSAG